MNVRQVRWIIAALSAAMLTWTAVRRRQRAQLADSDVGLEMVPERIVLPLPTLPAQDDATGEDEALETDMSRKVGSNRRIKVRGKQYGPFEAVLIGQRVEIAEIDGRLVVRQGSDEIGNFPLQD